MGMVCRLPQTLISSLMNSVISMEIPPPEGPQVTKPAGATVPVGPTWFTTRLGRFRFGFGKIS